MAEDAENPRRIRESLSVTWQKRRLDKNLVIGQPTVSAIIPARGGSKGIPGKNLREINGISLLNRAILSAQKAEIFQHIIVSTDSPEIAAEAERCGAIAHARPLELAEDKSVSEDALVEAIRARSIQTSHICFMECTSPFIDPKDLKRAWALSSSGKFDCVFSSSPTYDLHWRLRGKVAAPLGHNPMAQSPRQSRDPIYVETGAFYFFSREKFLAHKNRFFGTITIQEVPPAHGIEIDEPEDLIIAEALARRIDPEIYATR